MKRLAILFVAFAALCAAQQTVRWAATTGDVSTGSPGTTAATLQQVATSARQQAYIDQIVIYCSAACAITQRANGTAATSTTGTLVPILPSQLSLSVPLTFWTASNVGTGTVQGGITHIPAGGTAVLCLSPTCGAAAQVVLGTGGGTAANYTISTDSITATVNITFYGRSVL
jgi:hypothetical protein